MNNAPSLVLEIELRFRDCPHIVQAPALHDPADNHSQCFVCHPELCERPLPGKCPKCTVKAMPLGLS